MVTHYHFTYPLPSHSSFPNNSFIQTDHSWLIKTITNRIIILRRTQFYCFLTAAAFAALALALFLLACALLSVRSGYFGGKGCCSCISADNTSLRRTVDHLRIVDSPTVFRDSPRLFDRVIPSLPGIIKAIIKILYSGSQILHWTTVNSHQLTFCRCQLLCLVRPHRLSSLVMDQLVGPDKQAVLGLARKVRVPLHRAVVLPCRRVQLNSDPNSTLKEWMLQLINPLSFPCPIIFSPGNAWVQ